MKKKRQKIKKRSDEMNFDGKTLEELIERKIELINELVGVARAVHAKRVMHAVWGEVLDYQSSVESILSGVWGDKDYRDSKKDDNDYLDSDLDEEINA
jgi:hypothetical protein